MFKRFWKGPRWAEPEFTDGVVDLVPIQLVQPEKAMGFGQVYDYVIAPSGQCREAGRISLRMGESPCVYYFGHIGYHVDPPFRGQHFAARACELLKPLIAVAGKSSVVITCDPDNAPSRRTCERIGAVLEREVDVPEEIYDRWEISARKLRYVWRVDARLPEL